MACASPTLPARGGGYAQFLALLNACARDAPADATPPCPPEVDADARQKLKLAPLTLVGHSMGAIVINELVQAFPDLNYRDIVFLAGAATIGHTKASLEPVLRERHPARRGSTTSCCTR